MDGTFYNYFGFFEIFLNVFSQIVLDLYIFNLIVCEGFFRGVLMVL